MQNRVSFAILISHYIHITFFVHFIGFRSQCNGSFLLAKELVPKCLDACPAQTIRRFFQKTWRYMDAYRKGLTGVMAEHAVKKFTSHRKITKQIMMEVAMLVM